MAPCNIPLGHVCKEAHRVLVGVLRVSQHFAKAYPHEEFSFRGTESGAVLRVAPRFRCKLLPVRTLCVLEVQWLCSI